MRRSSLFVAVVGLTVAFAGCESKTEPADAAPSAVESPTPEPEAEPEPEPELEEPAYLTGTTSLKKMPTDDKRIEDPEGKSEKKVSNWKATLYRGEEVTVMGKEGDWTSVTTSAGDEGWLKSKSLVRAADVKLATVLEDTKIFKRPDLLALDASKTVGAGNLLFVAKTKEQFTEVNYPRTEWSGSDAWVLSEKLITDTNEIAAAKLIMNVLTLRSKKDDSAVQLAELARSQFGESRLLKLLDEDEEPEGEAAAEGEAAPEGEAKPEGAAAEGAADGG